MHRPPMHIDGTGRRHIHVCMPPCRRAMRAPTRERMEHRWYRGAAHSVRGSSTGTSHADEPTLLGASTVALWREPMVRRAAGGESP